MHPYEEIHFIRLIIAESIEPLGEFLGFESDSFVNFPIIFIFDNSQSRESIERDNIEGLCILK